MIEYQAKPFKFVWQFLSQNKARLAAALNPYITVKPTVDVDGNVIVANSSDYTVEVANGASHLINDFSGMLIVNDHYDGRVETWICGGGDSYLLGYTNSGAGTCNSTLTMAENGYEWTNIDNMTGPFTFTVIKTRSGS